MYESSFELERRPFGAAPAAANYFAAPCIEAARLTLARCIERAEGAGFLVGPAGSGKSLLCQVLAEQFAEQLPVALLNNGHLSSRRALLQSMSFELGLPYRDLEEGELRLALIDYLARSGKCPQGMLLIVDEAHTLSLRLLEEIRLMTNLVRGGQTCVRLLLAGSPELEERFASPRLESFSQRLAARCYLSAMARSETFDYVRFQIVQAGGRPEAVMGDDALEAVFRATDGVPRLINQVCDHALLLAYSDGRTRLDAELVATAWSDLQQLPAPWGNAGPRAAASQGEVLEFGGLNEDDDSESDRSATGDDFAAPYGNMHSSDADLTSSDGALDGRDTDRLGPLHLEGELREPIQIEQSLDLLHADVSDLDEGFGGGNVFDPNLELAGQSSSNDASDWGASDRDQAYGLQPYAALQSDADWPEVADWREEAALQGVGYREEMGPQDEAVVAPWPVESHASISTDAWSQAESICQASTSDSLVFSCHAESQTGQDEQQEENMEEEVVFDPYAAMDALQAQGSNAFFATSERPIHERHAISVHRDDAARIEPTRPLASGTAASGTVASGTMEQMLTLAEALLMEEASATGGQAPTVPFQIVGADDFCVEGACSVEGACTAGDCTVAGDAIANAETVAVFAVQTQATDQVRNVADTSAPSEDHDMIVVENTVVVSPIGPPPTAPSPPASVRRQEYKQLFARLRRG